MSSNNEIPPILDWLKRLWLPITGFTGAVTVLVEFLDLWRGNRELVSWISFSLGYFLLIGSIAYVAFSKQDSQLLPPRKVPVFPRLYKPARWSLGIVLALSSFSIAAWLRLITPTSDPTPTANQSYANYLTTTPGSCSSAIITSPPGTNTVENAGVISTSFQLSWVPSDCIMTVKIESSGLLSEAIYERMRSGQIFSIDLKGPYGELLILIWPYGSDYENELPVDSTIVFVDAR